MHTKEAVRSLRESLGLSQDQFAAKLYVTRQAVSRWENGDTVPGTDTLKLIASTFGVPVDELLGNPAGQCQSCGMVLARDSDKGTERDGGRSEEYCAFCYRDGAFAPLTMEQIVEHNLRDLDEWNKASGMQMKEDEARAALMEFLPTLKRWNT